MVACYAGLDTVGLPLNLKFLQCLCGFRMLLTQYVTNINGCGRFQSTLALIVQWVSRETCVCDFEQGVNTFDSPSSVLAAFPFLSPAAFFSAGFLSPFFSVDPDAFFAILNNELDGEALRLYDGSQQDPGVGPAAEPLGAGEQPITVQRLDQARGK